MTISLTLLSQGTLLYIATHNTNYTLIQAAVNALQNAVDVAIPNTGTSAVATLDDIWAQSGLIGISSFLPTSATATTVSLTSGAAWFLNQTRRGKLTTAGTLNFTGKTSGVYGIQVDTNGAAVVCAASATVPEGQLQAYTVVYNATGFGSITRVAPILLAGDDYDRMLSGAVYGSHTRVADRLSSIEGATLLDAMYAQRVLSGLTWDYKAGQVRNNNTIFSAASGTITLAASARHFVEVDPTVGTVSYNVAGYTSGFIPLHFLQTSGSVVISNTDARTWATLAGSGGGALALSGTTTTSWALNIGITSTPVSNASFEVRRGTSATVMVRWNEASDQWQFTNDGSTFVDLMGIQNFGLGAGSTTRLTMIASAPQVLNVTAQTTTSAPPYNVLDLSSYVSTAAVAVLMRVRVFDSNPLAVSALGSAPGIRFYRDSATIVGDLAAKVWAVPASTPQPMTVMVPISGTSCVYAIDASSDLSCDVAANLIAAFEGVQGVGTALVSATVTGLTASVGANTYLLSYGQLSAVANRALIYQLEVSGTLGAGSLYDILFYENTSLSAGALLFEADGVDASAAYSTRLGWMLRDTASSLTTYMKISHAGASAGLFSLKMVGERYA